MNEPTKQRHEIMSAIIQELGTRGREMRSNDLKTILKQRFENDFEDERWYFLSFDSQTRLLEDMGLISICNTLIGLTSKGLKAYETKDGLKGYVKNERATEALSKASYVASIISAIVGVLTIISATKQNTETYTVILIVAGFITGFATHALLPNLLSILSKFRSRPKK